MEHALFDARNLHEKYLAVSWYDTCTIFSHELTRTSFLYVCHWLYLSPDQTACEYRCAAVNCVCCMFIYRSMSQVADVSSQSFISKYHFIALYVSLKGILHSKLAVDFFSWL